MANILLIHSGFRGISNACLAIAKRLTKAGHKVYMGDMLNEDQDAWSDSISAVKINSINFHYQEAYVKNLKKSKNRNEGVNDSLYDLLYEDLDFDAFDTLYKSKNIDLVLIDMELHEYILYLHYKELPFILINQWFSIWKAKNNLPPSSNLVPESSMQVALVWSYSWCKGYFKTVTKSLRFFGKTRRNFILYLTNKFEIDKNILGSYYFPLPFSYRDFPVISTTHPELEFNSDSLANLKYVYPMVDPDRMEFESEKFKNDFPKILAKLQNEKKKLILVTRSSMSKTGDKSLGFLLQALLELDDCVCMLSLGDKFEEYAKYDKLNNLHLYKFLPVLKLLQHAAVSINHGGIHTINECIHFKVPMFIISGNKFDQNGCAARVNHFGCGINYKGILNKVSIQKSISSLLQDENYQNKIDLLNQSYLQSMDDQVLEKIIDNSLT